MNETIDYMEAYNTFEKEFRLTQVSGEEIGAFIMKMTGFFIRYNVRYGDAIRAFSAIKAGFQSQIDVASGKTMSSAKAELLADATPEAHMYEMARIHVTNLEQIINSMKSLQRGAMTEYSHASL